MTQHMQVQVIACNAESLVLSAPLAPNANHHGTAFGGSLASLAVLCGWGLLHLCTEDAGLHCDLVVQKTEMTYDKAVNTDLKACCIRPDENEWQRFTGLLKKRGRARLRLQVDVMNNDEVAVRLEATYAAALKNHPGTKKPG